MPEICVLRRSSSGSILYNSLGYSVEGVTCVAKDEFKTFSHHGKLPLYSMDCLLPSGNGTSLYNVGKGSVPLLEEICELEPSG